MVVSVKDDDEPLGACENRQLGKPGQNSIHTSGQRVKFALRGGASSANTLVELVDRAGQVVQATRTTDQGNYRFKTVDKGQYKVRVRKSGFAYLEQPIEAAPATAPAKASMSY